MDRDQDLITSIVPQRRRPGRVSVFVNGEFALGAEHDRIMELGWREGMPLSPEVLERAREELEYKAARAAAETYLGYRARTEQEVVHRLEEKGYSPAAVEEAVRYLKGQGYINDEEYAARYAESAVTRKLGRRRLVTALRQKGVDADVAKEAGTLLTDQAEADLAREFVRKRAAGMAHLDPAVRQRRLAAALQRRGFPYPVVRRALEQAEGIGESEDEVND